MQIYKTFILFILLISISGCLFEASKNGEKRTRHYHDKNPNRNNSPQRAASTPFNQLSKSIRIHMFHDVGNPAVSSDELGGLIAATKFTSSARLPDFLYKTPNMSRHNDGIEVGNLTVLNSRSNSECGNLNSLKTVKEKISNCEKVFKENATWNGRVLGTLGEGKWHLVSRVEDSNGVGFEIWLDEITNLLWSSDLGMHRFDNAVGNATDEVCIGYSNNYKLGNFDSSEVFWRLPTRNDWLQADLNGARFVLLEKTPENEDWKSLVYWTATYSSEDITQAWTYRLHDGVLATAPRGSDNSFVNRVRCVGHIIKK